MLLEEGGLWCVRGCRGGSETGECWFETIPVLAALCHGVNIKHKGSKVKHRQKASQREREEMPPFTFLSPSGGFKELDSQVLYG